MTMPVLDIRPADSCRWDGLALGEVMLRLDPEWGRVRTARTLRVCEGGGEYNVCRALRKCFGLRTAIVTAIVDNEIGHLLEDLVNTGAVDMSYVRWVPFDGLGRASRVGLNFTEKGFGIRPAVGTSDRGHTAASQLRPGDIDWETIFGVDGVRWFHTGGIFAALSATTPDVVVEAVTAANKYGTIVSYDLNYRPSLWDSHGGSERAIEVNQAIAPMVDVMIGNEEDFTASLGFEVQGIDESLSALDPAAFEQMIRSAVDTYPNLKVVATTLRNAKTATINDWSAVMFAQGEFHTSRRRENLEIYDRVGGGDGFASGLAYAFLAGKSPAEAVEYGAAHGALVMTTPGDISMVTLAEVERAIGADAARVIR
ncbi:MAG: sugar kinase [Acidimicrobiia bacterium]|nr:MAG: sugar kinase [Acidimicrobiia bacterium]